MTNFTTQCVIVNSDFSMLPGTGAYPQAFIPATRFFTNTYPVMIPDNDFIFYPAIAQYPQIFIPATRFFDNVYPIAIAELSESIRPVARTPTRTAKGSLVVVWKLL